MLNVLLGTFNLLPVPPLDGNYRRDAAMSEGAAIRFLDWTRRQGLVGILLAWVLYGRIFRFYFPRLAGGVISGLPVGVK